MTVAQRRRQSAGVSRITDCIEGPPNAIDVLRRAVDLQQTIGRPLRCADYSHDGRYTTVTFEVVDRD